MDTTLIQIILMLGRIALPLVILVLVMCLGEFFRRRAEKGKKKEDIF